MKAKALHVAVWRDQYGKMEWELTDGSTMKAIAYGSTPDEKEAFEQAKIAWEQHSEGEK